MLWTWRYTTKAPSRTILAIGCGGFVGGEEMLDDVTRQADRAQCARIDAAPARLDLGQDFLTPTDDGFIEGARALHFFQQDRRDHLIIKEGRVAVGDFMLERDPEMLGDRFGRRKRPPMVEHGALHPFEIAGIVDMTHEVDVVRLDADGIEMGNRVTHNDVNIIPARGQIGGLRSWKQFWPWPVGIGRPGTAAFLSH